MSIVKRTVFYEKKDGQPFRFSDWSMVVTTDVGSCVEPTCFAHRGPQDPSATWTYDPTDEITRVDLLKNIDFNSETNVLSGFGPFTDDVTFGAIHGGKLHPRDGR